MALTDAYFTKEEYYGALKIPLSTAEQDTAVERGAVSVSRFLDRVTNRGPFGKDDAPVTRQIRASHDGYLDLRSSGVPGIATTTGFVATVDSIILDNVNDLIFLPVNAALDSLPYTELELASESQISSFYHPTGWIPITAVWGYPEVPSLVKDTAIELLGIWRAESPRSTGRMNELDQVVADSPMANQLVQRFIKAMRRTAVG